MEEPSTVQTQPQTAVELHPRYDMFKTIKKIYVKPATLSPGEAMVIDRATEDIGTEYLNRIPTPSKRIPILGVMGIVKMVSCSYLVVIEEISRVGPEPGEFPFPYFLSNTWRIDKVNMVPVAPGKTRVTQKTAQINDFYHLAMLELLNAKTLYFSYDIDLSHTLQRTADFGKYEAKQGLFARAKKMFIWNIPILMPFFKIATASTYVVPVVNGFVSTRTLMVENVKLYLSLISRRRRSRSGKRYFCRGINKKGYCANFVETEMIIEVRKKKVGFVLTRGSFPFYWIQWPDMSFTPKTHVMHHETSDDAFELFVREMIGIYGRLYLFDMVNEHRDPKTANEFSQILKECVDNSEYVDRIHAQTIDLFSLNWADEDLFSIEVYGGLREMLMTVVTKAGLQQRQKGIFHVCSLDGVDLTDVLQFAIAKLAMVSAVLHFELASIANRFATQKNEIVAYLTSELAILWAAQSDALALYSVGTRSLGSDFYKTNMLSTKKSWGDVFLKIERWYVNNFRDGVYQDCLEVLTKDVPLENVVEDPCKLSILCRMENQLRWLFCTEIAPTCVVFCTLQLLLLWFQHNDIYCLGGWSLLLLLSLFLTYNNISCIVDEPKSVKKPDIHRTPMDWYYK